MKLGKILCSMFLFAVLAKTMHNIIIIILLVPEQLTNRNIMVT